MANIKKSQDIQVSKKMLDHTRDELKSDITSLKLEMKAEFKKVDAKFKKVDARFKEVDARFNQVESKIDDVKAEIQTMQTEVQKLAADIHRLLAIFEEQNNRNKYVLNGFAILQHLIERNKKEIDERFLIIENSFQKEIVN